MAQIVRVGVVGTSWWADAMYLPSLKSHPQAEVVAICGRKRERAEEMAAKYDIAHTFTDYREMIGQSDLDAIVVGVPDDVHHSVTMEGLRASLHVLCDKPLAVTAQQALEMVGAAEAAEVQHMVLFTYRWMPFYRYVRDLLDQGYIGRCYHCEFRFLMGWAREREYLWRFDRNRSAGVLGDLGSHMIDMARWLVGDISRVSALLGVFVDRPGADGGPINPASDSAFMLAEFANGAGGVIHTSAVAHMADRFAQQQIKLYGEDGSLEISNQFDGTDAGALIRGARNQDEQFETLETPASYWGEVSRSDPFQVFTKQSAGCRAFIDAILNDVPTTPTFYDGYKAQRVMEAVVEANDSGRWVAIEE